MTPQEVSHIAGLGLPVLCTDTCSVLDILRDPTRDTARAHERLAAQALLAAMTTGAALVSLVADQVRREFAENIPKVEQEATQALTKLRERVIRANEIDKVFGGAGVVDLSHLDDHVQRARVVADDWMAASNTVGPTPAIADRAFARLMAPRTPGKRGQSMKDCVVIETYLEVVSALRVAGLASRIVFASSNTADYANEQRGVLNGDLQAEFTTLNIQYAPNLPAAKYWLGL
ncbi:hypothetical protein [Bradyrhizobium sp. 144]|uniref:hypothetical protein n=1 Tax=Bradyrhizobium sp. 144 TaxID=2782620 RepID=UPI001FFA2A66|nr:hypothetical protein [Bradyrhizobium sp. 144]MCK1695230.1 hypothetical protein [Bradyrhizobium sp. 144]